MKLPSQGEQARPGRRQLLALACGFVCAGCGDLKIGVGRPPRAATNMTADDRERGRANMLRVMDEAYRPELTKLRSELLAVFARTVKGTPDRHAARSLAIRAEAVGRDRHFAVVLGLVGWRRQFGELEAVDVARVRAELDVLAEHDVITALAIGHAAGLAGSGVAARTIATRGRQAFPVQPRATDEQVHALMGELARSLADIKQLYLAALRRSQPPEIYAKIAPGYDTLFDPYIALADRDAKSGPLILAGSRSAKPNPAARTEPIADVGARSEASVGALLDSTSILFPAFGAVIRGIDAAQALAAGDPRKAMSAAIGMLPMGALAKEALRAGANLAVGAMTG